MNTINLLYGLNKYLTLAAAIAQNPADDLHYSVSLSYNTIVIKLEQAEAGTRTTHLQCTFEINNTTSLLKDVSAQSPESEKSARDLILLHYPGGQVPWTTEITGTVYPPEAERYLTIADTIAKEVYLFDSGDDYKPGYFTEIIAAPDYIILHQVNWRNARSTAHKDNYFMRRLEFVIPLSSEAGHDTAFGEDVDDSIGKMKVRLSDRSSPQNRAGGDMIREKIKALKSDSEKSGA